MARKQRTEEAEALAQVQAIVRQMEVHADNDDPRSMAGVRAAQKLEAQMKSKSSTR